MKKIEMKNIARTHRPVGQPGAETARARLGVGYLSVGIPHFHIHTRGIAQHAAVVHDRRSHRFRRICLEPPAHGLPPRPRVHRNLCQPVIGTRPPVPPFFTADLVAAPRMARLGNNARIVPTGCQHERGVGVCQQVNFVDRPPGRHMVAHRAPHHRRSHAVSVGAAPRKL